MADVHTRVPIAPLPSSLLSIFEKEEDRSSLLPEEAPRVADLLTFGTAESSE